jgi:hypothetical protein
MSFSDYKPDNIELIKELLEHKDYLDVQTDLYLSLISIANNRSTPKEFDSILYDDYFDGELIYETSFIERMIEINHLSRLSDNLKKYDVFQYNNLDKDIRERLNKLILRIEPNYDLSKYKYKDLLSKVCYDIEADILPKLLKSLYTLEEKLSKIEIRIISIIKISLLIGVIFPLLNLTIGEYEFKNIISEILILINLFMLVSFVFSIEKFSREQI